MNLNFISNEIIREQVISMYMNWVKIKQFF